MRKKQMEGFSLYDIYEDGRIYSNISNKFLKLKISNGGWKR